MQNNFHDSLFSTLTFFTLNSLLIHKEDSIVPHASLLPGGAESFVEAFPDKIICSHISDNDLYLDRHVPIREGKIDFRRVLNLLKDIGFEGTLNIKLKTNEDRLLSKQRLETILNELDIDH